MWITTILYKSHKPLLEVLDKEMKTLKIQEETPRTRYVNIKKRKSHTIY